MLKNIISKAKKVLQSDLERSKLGSVFQCPERPCRPKLQLKAVEQTFLGVTEKSVQVG